MSSAETIIFLAIVLACSIGFLWLWRHYARLQDLQGLTDDEIGATRKQMKAFLLLPVIVLIIPILGSLPAAGPIAQQVKLWLPMALTLGMIGYVSLSSIRHQVTIFPSWKRRPVRGPWAMFTGLANLVLVLAIIGYVIFSVQ